MDKIYLDFNIIAYLSGGIRKNEDKYITLFNNLVNLKNQQKLSFYYSISHIFESHDRNNEIKTDADIKIIKELTDDNQLQLVNNEIVCNKIDPFYQYDSIKPYIDFIKINKNLLLDLIDFSSIVDLKKYGLSNDILHKIPQDKIFEYLDKLYQDIQNNMTEEEINNISEKIFNNFKTKFPEFIENFFNNILRIFENKIPQEYITLIKNQFDLSKNKAIEEFNKITFKNNYKEKINSMFSTIKDIFKAKELSMQFLPGAYQKFLELSNYHPDKEKDRIRKSPIGDLEDSSHYSFANYCDIFVTDDKHRFKIRAEAVNITLKNDLKIFDENNFMQYINKFSTDKKE